MSLLSRNLSTLHYLEISSLQLALASTGAGAQDLAGARRLIGEVVKSRRRPLLGPSPG